MRVCQVVMNRNFAPKKYTSNSLGSQKSFKTVPWKNWFEQNEPLQAKYISFVESEGEMKNVQYGRTNRPSFEDSLTNCLSKSLNLIILDGDWSSAVSANNFLNNIAPSTMRFREGTVGVVLFRQLQAILMSAIGQGADTSRDKYLEYARNIIVFIRKLEQSFPEYKTTWFGTVRTVVENNTEPEDILPFLLASGVLGVPISRNRLAAWLHLSLRRSFKHGPLRNNSLGLVVWRFATALINNVPDKQAVETAFESLLNMSTYSDLDIVQHLIEHILPELKSEEESFLRSVKESRAFYPVKDIIMRDGSIVCAKFQMPLNLVCHGGSIQKEGDRYAITVSDYNRYIPITFERPEDKKVTVTVYGRPVQAELASAHGPGVVIRTTTSPITDGRGFMGKDGLTLRGGRGNGRGSPTQERPMPAFMTKGSEDSCEICSVCFDTLKYSLSTPSWDSPLIMAETLPFCTVFVKGIRQVTIALNIEEEKPVLPLIDASDITNHLAGMTLSEMQPISRHSLANLTKVMTS